jgi:hypothetical protein
MVRVPGQQRLGCPITETGVDQPFVIACATFWISLFVVILAISKLRVAGLSKFFKSNAISFGQ